MFVYFSPKYCFKHRASRLNTIPKADVYQITQSNWFCFHIIAQGIRGCVKIRPTLLANMQKGCHFCAEHIPLTEIHLIAAWVRLIKD